MKLKLASTAMATLALGVGTLVSTPTASAATNAWGAYYAPKGSVCVTEYVDKWGDHQYAEEVRVLTKSSTRVVESSDGINLITSLRSDGGAKTDMAYREDGLSIRVTQTLPPVQRFLRGQTGTGTMTLSMTLPKKEARMILIKGNKLVVTAKYRMSRIKDRNVELGDGTRVQALGMKSTLTSVQAPLIKSSERSSIKASMRPAFAMMAGSSWIAKQRGTVFSSSPDGEGGRLYGTQAECR